ncbi:MAG: hypothetical protein AAGG44_10355 [Planctomycetota bacterium]
MTPASSGPRRESDSSSQSANPYEPTQVRGENENSASRRRKPLEFRWGVRRVKAWQLVILVLFMYAFFSLVIVPLLG